MLGLLIVIIFFCKVKQKPKKKLASTKAPAANPAETLATERDLISKDDKEDNRALDDL